MAFFILVVVSLWMPAVSNSRFRGHAAVQGVDELRGSLLEALDAILIGGTAAGRSSRLELIEDSIAATFQAMPQSTPDRLGHRAVRHVMRSYFAKEHGWSLVGLGRSEADVTGNGAGILEANAPTILESILEAHEQGQGLSLPEVIAVVAALEHLILDESVKLLEVAYDMNGYEDTEDLSEEHLREVLLSYVALYKHAHKNITINPAGHLRWKQKQVSTGKLNLEMQLTSDSLHSFNFARREVTNPFRPRSYSFHNAAQIVDSLAQQMGRHHHESCQAMQQMLDSFDTSGTGRVLLKDFYAANAEPYFLLNENLEELRELGALDETVPGQPMVRIANYIVSPSNCGDFSDFYQGCCISPCDGLIHQLEAQFLLPAATPAALLAAVRNLTDAPDQDLNIPTSLLMGPQGAYMERSLTAIAQRHGGLVPLHGSLLATWMHFAFPRECPLPRRQDLPELHALAADTMEMVASQEWLSEMELHMPDNSTAWTEAHELPLFDDVEGMARELRLSQCLESLTRSFARTTALLAAAAAVLLVAIQHCRSVATAFGHGAGKGHKQHSVLPLRF